jgi:hypothetical protein
MLFKLLGWRGRMDLDEERYSTWGWGPHALTSHGHGHGHGGRRHPMAAMVPPPPEYRCIDTQPTCPTSTNYEVVGPLEKKCVLGTSA